MKQVTLLKHSNRDNGLEELQEDERNIIAFETSKVKGQNDLSQEELFDRKILNVEKSFDKTFLRAIAINEAACKINIAIYLLMVGFGTTLILDSIIISAFSGISLLSSFLALLGVFSLVAVLQFSPQSKISQNAAKNLQYQILYSGFISQIELLKKIDANKIGKTTDNIKQSSQMLEKITSSTVDKIGNLGKNKSSI